MKSVKIIAEAGVNHNGNLDMAIALVDAAVSAGADSVKFQTFKSELMVTADAGKARYQSASTTAVESQFNMLKRLELSHSQFLTLSQYCREHQIEFLSTAFDGDSLMFLHKELELTTFKVASGELFNAPLLLEHAYRAKCIIMSTGMATVDDIRHALGVLAFGFEGRNDPCATQFSAAYLRARTSGYLAKKVILLHCTTEYPTPLDQVNLKAMDVLRREFELDVGYSDHTNGITVAIAAAALGACVIEKHFTLDKSLPGPDHGMSLDPVELTAMVTGVREVEQSLGDGRKMPTSAEIVNASAVKKSLVAARTIRMGEEFSQDNVCIKRPGTGVEPMKYWSYLGRKSDRSYVKDEVLQ